MKRLSENERIASRNRPKEKVPSALTQIQGGGHLAIPHPGDDVLGQFEEEGSAHDVGHISALRFKLGADHHDLVHHGPGIGQGHRWLSKSRATSWFILRTTMSFIADAARLKSGNHGHARQKRRLKWRLSAALRANRSAGLQLKGLTGGPARS